AVALIGARVSWRVQIALALVIAAAGDAASVLTTGSPLFGWVRLVAGLGEGAIISLSFTFVGITTRAERNVALYLALLLTYGAFGLWSLPRFL
ncbi:hypothetical protein ABTL52_19880, partial [Acinetobacter baumannii]